MAVALVRTPATGTAPSASTSVSVTFTAATAGNLLLLGVGMDKASGAANTIAGWTLLASQSGTSASMAVWYKIAVGGETTVTGSWTTAATAGAGAYVAEYSGVDTTTPVTAANTFTYSDTATTTIALDPPAAGANGGGAFAPISIDTATAVPWAVTAPSWTRQTSAGNAGGMGVCCYLTADAALTGGQDLSAVT